MASVNAQRDENGAEIVGDLVYDGKEKFVVAEFDESQYVGSDKINYTNAQRRGGGRLRQTVVHKVVRAAPSYFNLPWRSYFAYRAELSEAGRTD